MKKKMFLSCLIKGGSACQIVKILKKHKELEIGELEEKIKRNAMITIKNYPFFIEKGSNISLSPNYHFVITSRSHSQYLHKLYREQNKEEDSDEFERIVRIWRYRN